MPYVADNGMQNRDLSNVFRVVEVVVEVLIQVSIECAGSLEHTQV